MHPTTCRLKCAVLTAQVIAVDAWKFQLGQNTINNLLPHHHRRRSTSSLTTTSRESVTVLNRRTRPNFVSMSNGTMYPRAAVAATIQWKKRRKSPSSTDAIEDSNNNDDNNYYLCIQRKNPPDQGLWSIPGGKIQLGETTLKAAKREVYEETQIRADDSGCCYWHPVPFCTTDAIFESNNNKEGGSTYDFHYVIAHCFARIISPPPPLTGHNEDDEDGQSQEFPIVVPSDDALDARWMSLVEVKELDRSGLLSSGVIAVIERAEELDRLGALLTRDERFT